MGEPRGEIRALTGLRGIAAVTVMVDHYMAVDFSTPFPWFLLPHGYVAVDMFMILSGFVLAMRYEARFRRMGPSAAMALFLKHRIARLYPMYALMTLVCFALCRAGWLTFLHPDTSLAALGANLLGVQTWLWPRTSLDGPGWSISAEWAANLAFPLLLSIVLGGSGRRTAALVIVAGLVLLACGLRFGTLFDVPAAGVVNIISGPEALGRCGSEFVFGMALWRVRSRNAWGRHFGGGGMQAGLVAVLAALLFFPRLDVLFAALTGGLVLGLSYRGSWLARSLGWRWVHWLGTVSYTIYVVHIALLPLRDLLGTEFAALPHGWVAAVACTAGATMAASAMLYRLVEKPSQRWLATVWIGPATPRAAPAWPRDKRRRP